MFKIDIKDTIYTKEIFTNFLFPDYIKNIEDFLIKNLDLNNKENNNKVQYEIRLKFPSKMYIDEIKNDKYYYTLYIIFKNMSLTLDSLGWWNLGKIPCIILKIFDEYDICKIEYESMKLIDKDDNRLQELISHIDELKEILSDKWKHDKDIYFKYFENDKI